DTGRLIFENVNRADFEVCAWLLEQGASLKLVRVFLQTIKEDRQIEILNQLLPSAQIQVIQGHSILFSYMELEENIPGLSVLVEKLMEFRNPDACFSVFFIRKSVSVILIARSQKPQIDLHELLQKYGGGGHQFAASATIHGRDGLSFYNELCLFLEKSLAPAIRAADIMNTDIPVINENKTLLEASVLMEETELTGIPVANDQGGISGFMSLKDIMKGRKAGHIKAPIKSYMSRKIISSPPSSTMREIERIFYKYHIGHLLVIENGKLLGVVTRWDFLQVQKHKNQDT
ncbi:MAG: CBS domain-containing protein, partial [Treponema sp.]|nr:CBS domain-containing protein [Treponema sp.]